MRLLYALSSLLVAVPLAAQPAFVAGRVVDEHGEGLPYANVFLDGTLDGAASDAEGAFVFPAQLTGTRTVRATMLGFADATARIPLAPGDTTRVRLVLRPILLELDEALVTSAYTTGDLQGTTLSALEVVTTPGAFADLFRTLQAFPGVTGAQDGAGIYVRGGMPSETRTLIDGAFLAHPYKYESATDGTFGTLPPFLVANTAFATGGFSARYGNALSGVLTIETPGLPDAPALTTTVGLAAASAEIATPVGNGTWGLRATGNRSFTGLLFAVNGQQEVFSPVPQGVDGSLSLTYRYGAGGEVKLFAFGATDRLGVRVDENGYSGRYRSSTSRGLGLVRWADRRGAWRTDATLARSAYASRQHLGSLDLRPGEASTQLRFDAVRPLGTRWLVRVGAEGEWQASTYDGQVPQGDVFDPAAPVYTLDERLDAQRAGAYAEATVQPARRLLITAGIRADGHRPAGQVVFDPRVEALWAFSEAWQARVAWGRYHQFREPFAYAAEVGNPHLQAEAAQHVIAGVRYERGLLLARAEAYHKAYRQLALETPEALLANAGRGTARGLDVFARYGAFLRTRANGWVSYSLLDARRDQTRHVGQTAGIARGPTPFDVRHTLTGVAKLRLVGFWYVGSACTLASGQAHTPIEGGEAHDGYWLPVEGPLGSERLPAFVRLDAQVSYYWPLAEGLALTLFGALSNATNRANVTGYTYSADFATRTPDVTSFRRSAYAGFTLLYAR